MPRKPEEPWFQRVAERMVQEGKSFPQACSEEDVFLRTDEADKHFRRASFQKVLRQVRLRYHIEVARDPDRGKSSTLGQLQVCATKLMEEGSYDKAAEVLLKISKLEGWVGPDQNIQVFGGLTQTQIDAAREALRQKIAESPRQPSAVSGTDGAILPN